MRRDEQRLKSEESLRARCEFDPALPINQRRDEIAAAIRDHRVVVLCGQTGSGKTTQLPKICLTLGLGKRGIIGHTQPRRLAARAVAARIAEELRIAPSDEAVGVKVRFEDRTGPGTVIKLMTDGTLLAETQSDPLLSAYSALIIDEAHERSLNIDFLLGILRGVLRRRQDLKVIVTSATIDPAKFAAHFAPVVGPVLGPVLGPAAGAVVPVIEVSGRMFHVEHRYVSSQSTSADLSRNPPGVEPELVGDAVDELLGPRGCGGDVLVFLPGEKEIRACQTHLRRTLGDSVDVLALMSRMSSDEQDRIFHVGGRRRVILSTNIAETSLTVPGIRGVVDTGLARISRYDHRTRVQTLPIERISRASAAQRSGRCGRVSEGVCIRLYEREDFDSRPEFTEPEIRRSNLASMILQSKVLGLGPLEDFDFLEKPDAGMLRDGYRLLWELGALSSSQSDGELTAIGRRLAGLPVDPKIGRMVLAAEEMRCLPDVLVLAAALSIQDPRERPMGREQQADAAHAVFRDGTSDFISLLNLWREYCARDGHARDGRGGGFAWAREHFVSGVRMREWVEVWEQLCSIAADLGLRGAGREGDAAGDIAPERGGASEAGSASKAGRERLHRALLTGLVGSACCRDEAGGGFEYRAARGVRCSIHPGSVLFKRSPKWIMAGEVVQTTKNYARCCAPIEPEWIEAVAPHVFERQMSDVHFDSEAGEARGFERVSMAGLVIVPRRSVAVAGTDPARARELLIEKVLCAEDGGAAGLSAGPGAGPGAGPKAGTEARAGAGESPSVVAFAAHNRGICAWAEGVRAKLRDRAVIRGEREIAAFFDRTLPRDVVDVRTLRAWLAREPGADARLRLSRADVAANTAGDAEELERRAGPARFPEEMAVGAERGRLEYRLSPGKDEDGVTLQIGLLGLAALRDERLAWLVPGMLGERVLAMIKGLGKDQRLALERA
ncbi:MAG: ATP-dependent RNA helicase HrpA, partial [Phycisphaerales bacterium]